MGCNNRIKLKIDLFGGLSITYEGKDISIGKNKTSKYIQLLEIVWLSGEDGITKDKLINTLYDREEQSNINNSFNNLIYQMHKQLQKSGLPDAEYIVCRNGIFYTDDNVEIDSDAVSFISSIKEARDTEDQANSILLYKNAFELYKAELLPENECQNLIFESIVFSCRKCMQSVWLHWAHTMRTEKIMTPCSGSIRKHRSFTLMTNGRSA